MAKTLGYHVAKFI